MVVAEFGIFRMCNCQKSSSRYTALREFEGSGIIVMIQRRDQSDRDFLATLQRLQPASVQELCTAIGITATAVRQRLLRLQCEGAVERQTIRQERGRPCHAYALTEAGSKLLGDDHAEIAAVLWREIMRIEQADVRQRVLQGVRAALVQRFGSQTDQVSLAGRLQRMCSALSEHGFDVDYSVESNGPGLSILREHNCPYHEIASADPSICDLEQSVFSDLLGVPVELSSCRLDGHRCCEFQVGSAT